MKYITKWCKDKTNVEKKDMYIQQGSDWHFRKTAKGWKLCVKWKDGTTTWEKLADLEESNPVDFSEYAVTNIFQDDPEFLRWVPYWHNTG